MTRVLAGALDMSRSEIKYFRSTGNIMAIKRFAFIDDRVRGHEIFKLQEIPTVEVFCGEAFRAMVFEKGLTGLRFEPL